MESFSREDSAAGENVEAFGEERRSGEEPHPAADAGAGAGAERGIACTQCGCAFTSEQQLNLHAAQHKQGDTKFLCEVGDVRIHE